MRYERERKFLEELARDASFNNFFSIATSVTLYLTWFRYDYRRAEGIVVAIYAELGPPQHLAARSGETDWLEEQIAVAGRRFPAAGGVDHFVVRYLRVLLSCIKKNVRENCRPRLYERRLIPESFLEMGSLAPLSRLLADPMCGEWASKLASCRAGGDPDNEEVDWDRVLGFE